MTNSHSVPLCRLPSPACDCVVKQLDLREKYVLATLSKRASRTVKIALRGEKYDIVVQIGVDFARIFFYNELCPPKSIDVGVDICLIGDDRTPDLVNPLLWTDNLANCLVEQLKFMFNVFNRARILLEYNGQDGPFDILKDFLLASRSLNLKFSDVEINNDDEDDELFDFAWENFRDVDDLSLMVPSTKNYEWKITQPFNFRDCTFKAFEGFSMDHVARLFMNCRKLHVLYTCQCVTPSSLNGFLKQWIQGSKLEFVRLAVNSNIDFEAIVDGIESVPVRKAYVQTSLIKFARGKAVKIRQNDGVEAVVALYENCETFVLTTHFASWECDLWSYLMRLHREEVENGKVEGGIVDIEELSDVEGDDENNDDEEVVDEEYEEMNSDNEEVSESADESSEDENGIW